MKTLVERGCGLDVHQATVVACLLTVRRDRKVQKQMRTFGTTTRELVGLREWLLSEGCTHVALESTGVYWKPIYAILEGALEIMVAMPWHLLDVLRVASCMRVRPISSHRAAGLLRCASGFRFTNCILS